MEEGGGEGCPISLWEFRGYWQVHFSAFWATNKRNFSHEDATIINQTKVLGKKLFEIWWIYYFLWVAGSSVKARKWFSPGARALQRTLAFSFGLFMLLASRPFCLIRLLYVRRRHKILVAGRGVSVKRCSIPLFSFVFSLKKFKDREQYC